MVAHSLEDSARCCVRLRRRLIGLLAMVVVLLRGRESLSLGGFYFIEVIADMMVKIT
jgi:hypothetical protein